MIDKFLEYGTVFDWISPLVAEIQDIANSPSHTFLIPESATRPVRSGFDLTGLPPAIVTAALPPSPVGGGSPGYSKTDTTDRFPLTLPWDDATRTWIDASDLLVGSPGDDPATVIDARGFVTTDDSGHFVFSNTGGRARFWGVNLGGDASLPPCPDYPPQLGEFNDVHAAEKLAARLAKLGFNAVRVHMIDEPWSIIWLHPWEDTKDLNPVGLGRLDYFVYQLKRHAIYVDLNLHAAREFTRNDGVTDADAFRGTGNWANTGATLFAPVMIALQKRYAEQLLRHVNPYTGLPYTDDPGG